MDYLLKASAVLFIFYACYQLFLHKETFFQANRWFLLLGLIIACVIPLVTIPVYIEYTVSNTNSYTISYDTLNSPQIIEEPFDYMQLMIWIYFSGLLFFFGKLILEFLSLRKLLSATNTKNPGKFILIETTKNNAPFSFFNRIVYNPDQFTKEELTHIINHEKVHAQQWHSIDTIVSQIACVLLWFNPFVWLYKKGLQQNLEFIADERAQHISVCEKSYQTVLLKTSIPKHQLVITNNFYTSLIKKRIVMLHKSKSKKLNQIKFILVLPALALFMMSFNTEEVYVKIPSEDIITPLLLQTENIEQIFTNDMSDDDLVKIKTKLSNKRVTFNYSGIKRNKNGEITAIKTEFEYNGNSGTYNADSDKAIEPFIFKSNESSFIVGHFTDRTPKIYTTENGKTKVQSTGSSSSYIIEEVIETDTLYLNKNAKNQTWTSKDGTKTTINASENGKTYSYITKTDEPLFIVDGKIVEKSVFEDVDSDNIKSINVLKGKSALEAYGKKGNNGVIVMETKSKNPWVIGEVFEVETYEISDSITHKKYSIDKKDNVTYDFISNKPLKDQPLYILDEKIISQKEFQLINPNDIKRMDIIKDENAKKIYGEKGKNGVIIITTTSWKANIEEREAEYKKSKKEGYEIKVSSVAFIDNNGEMSAEWVISKTSTDAFLEQQVKAIKKHGIEAKFSKVKRNKAGEITSIKISLDDNDGRTSSASWKEKEQAIPDIVMGKSKDNSLFVRAIGN
ncbi:M56 family metallopeptidase [Psychroserpens sp. Hel_I_66]|uniref:M56 family metallopeptidase n=1 Tax=Psychroserpens sp. Hel_I_66 TaxID=1250004 RepID=UPI00068958BB|nr:M56 family metallopeptidase [Psychroserpens sp. Hel_I_66]